MSNEKNTFLGTGLSQIETARILSDKMKPALDYITYNVERYKTPVSLVLFYTEKDISKSIKENKRLTDALLYFKIGNSYFNFVILPFTEEIDSYNFIKHEEYKDLNFIEHYYYFEILEPKIYNYFNFINSFLFKILEKKETLTRF